MSDRLSQLRTEAQSTEPAFSEPLHVATMARVNRARREQAGKAPGQKGLSLGWTRYALAAVAVGIGVWWMMPDRSVDTPMQISALMETLQESTSPIQEQFSRPITGPAGQLTLLQEDAVSLGEFIVGQFDVLPVQDDPAL